jgi:hypothetical protein
VLPDVRHAAPLLVGTCINHVRFYLPRHLGWRTSFASQAYGMSPQSPVVSPLSQLTDKLFVANWRCLFGYPPAVLLDDRCEMLAIVVATVPVLTYPIEARPA